MKLKSNDVIHSFWIPAINGKLDAVPGRTHTLIMTADKPGIYQGQCTEYCGLSHGVMRMELKALPPAEFDKWVDAMTSVPDQPTDPKAIAGQELFVSQCARCHQVDGLTPESSPPFKYSKLPDPEYGQTVDSTLTSKNAPNLTHLMMRQTFAGSLLPLYQGKAPSRSTAVPDGVRIAQPQDPAPRSGVRQADEPREQPGHAQPAALGDPDRSARRLPGDPQVGRPEEDQKDCSWHSSKIIPARARQRRHTVSKPSACSPAHGDPRLEVVAVRVDHKKIGIMYGVAAFFLLVGGSEALLIRTQLAVPGAKLLSADVYNQVFTMHGVTMIFLAVMPMQSAFANYLLPLQIGARDVAFPDERPVAWIWLSGAIFFNTSWFLGGGASDGWFKPPTRA